MSNLEQKYLATKKVMDNLRLHMKQQREELNTIAGLLLGNEEEYIFTDGSMAIKKPSNHTATKIKK
jgi:hypothetical protein